MFSPFVSFFLLLDIVFVVCCIAVAMRLRRDSYKCALHMSLVYQSSPEPPYLVEILDSGISPIKQPLFAVQTAGLLIAGNVSTHLAPVISCTIHTVGAVS